MGVPEPTKLPEWASVPGIDPVSLQPNIAEPSESKKDSGFNFKERPPRQDFNWWMNLVWGWVLHFKSRITGLYTNVDTVVDDAGLTPDVEDSDQLKSALDILYMHEYGLVSWNPSWTFSGGVSPSVSNNLWQYRRVGDSLLYIIGAVSITDSGGGLASISTDLPTIIGGKETRIDFASLAGGTWKMFRSGSQDFDFGLFLVDDNVNFVLGLDNPAPGALSSETFPVLITLPVKFVTP